MGTLVIFKRRESAPSTELRTPGDAQILIFTGVRYERQAQAVPVKQLDPTGKKRKRG